MLKVAYPFSIKRKDLNMLRNMRLSLKISLGFSIIMLLAMALGTLALFKMKTVEGLSTRLANEYVPEVAVANNVERYSLESMSAVRGYGLSQEKRYLDEGTKALEEVRKYLAEADRLAATSTDLSKLKGGVNSAEAKVNEYEQLIKMTVAGNEKITDLRKTMEEVADTFQKNVGEYVRREREKRRSWMASSAASDELLKLQSKIDTINQIIDQSNVIRILNFKFQAMGEPKLVDEAMKRFTVIEKELETLESAATEDNDKKMLTEIAGAGGAYKRSMTQLLAEWQALRDVAEKRGKTGREIVEMEKQAALAGMESAGNIASAAASSMSVASRVVTLGLGVVLLLGIVSAFVLARSITGPIATVMKGLNESADQVSSASGQVSTASQQLAEGASEQAAAIEETSSSLEEMASMTRQNADNASQANKLMIETKETVLGASHIMDKLTASMDEISRASEKTSKIIKTIDEIAFQTNLLALNAAVEAARAGEAGSGFAVVAEEVRGLAIRAAEAAKNTTGLIESTVKLVKEGAELVAKTAGEFSEVAARVSKSGELVGEISAASQEQANGIGHLNQAVSEMDKVVQQNSANAEESASASEEMNAQAMQMKEFVMRLVSLVGGTGGDHTGNKQPVHYDKRKSAPEIEFPLADENIAQF